MPLEIVLTEDGSITCRDGATGELYHNRAGAYLEALRNYVEPCNLAKVVCAKDELSVLDVCFGLGYNTFVLVLELLKTLANNGDHRKFRIKVTAIDRDPKIIGVLPGVLADERFGRLAELTEILKTYDCEASQESIVCQCLIENKTPVHLDLIIKFADLRKEVLALVEEGKQFDFIFHDGFSPKRMPELWTYDLFAQYSRLLDKHGLILTYSSATAVRGALRLCGLTVKRTATVGGKSGGTIAGYSTALKDNPYALSLSDLEEARLNSRSAIPYRDPTFSESANTIVARRLAEGQRNDEGDKSKS